MVQEITPPEFNSREMPNPSEKYVCWMDIMGTGSIMPRSLETSSIFIFKLHVAALEASESEEIHLYPMMDGVYAVSNSKQTLLTFLEKVFSAMAVDIKENINEEHYKYVVKASIAFGPVVHGEDIPSEASNVLEPNYNGSILLGMPMVQAYQSEQEAPPFGVYIHESARAFAPDSEAPFNHYWWEWFHPHGKDYDFHELAENLCQNLKSYYDWCEKNHNKIGYQIKKIKSHRDLCEEYLPEP